MIGAGGRRPDLPPLHLLSRSECRRDSTVAGSNPRFHSRDRSSEVEQAVSATPRRCLLFTGRMPRGLHPPETGVPSGTRCLRNSRRRTSRAESWSSDSAGLKSRRTWGGTTSAHQGVVFNSSTSASGADSASATLASLTHGGVSQLATTTRCDRVPAGSIPVRHPSSSTGRTPREPVRLRPTSPSSSGGPRRDPPKVVDRVRLAAKRLSAKYALDALRTLRTSARSGSIPTLASAGQPEMAARFHTPGERGATPRPATAARSSDPARPINARERARLPPLRLLTPRALARVTLSHGETARFDSEVGYHPGGWAGCPATPDERRGPGSTPGARTKGIDMAGETREEEKETKVR